MTGIHIMSKKLGMSESVKVVEVAWTYRDRWAAPDENGYSYHHNMDAAIKYINDYWDSMPVNTPDEYDCPDVPRWVEVNPVFGLLVAGQGSIRTYKKML